MKIIAFIKLGTLLIRIDTDAVGEIDVINCLYGVLISLEALRSELV